MFMEIKPNEADLLMLPGGMPGASNLKAHEELCEALLKQNEKGKMISAICAAPAVVLAQLGILDGRRATCYPGFENMLTKATYTGELVTVNGNITTAEGPAAAFPYAYELLAQLTDRQTSDQIAEGMRFVHLMNA
jgi:4-methyl-5(b-hydroxyethyl)-thiazole monophosphate biosynthesis